MTRGDLAMLRDAVADRLRDMVDLGLAIALLVALAVAHRDDRTGDWP